jgi:hypothetical protein
MQRNSCVICEHTIFENVYKLTNYPSSSSPGINNDYNEDLLSDIVFKGCTSCGCVQLETLINPDILYQEYHNDTVNTPTWKLHHSSFSSFILNNFNDNKILEIGGYTAVLAKKIIQELKCKYTILDIVQQPPNHTDIDYISANCETFDYNNEKTVIMSHVFEHIYNPTKLINQFIKSGVENVFISIPNMNSLLRTNNIAILHVEHTFYIDEYDIKSMFSKAGFVCSAQQYFKDHSIFFHFKKHAQCTSFIYVKTDRIIQQKDIYKKIESFFSSFEINQPCFIAPAGNYGQKIYYYLKQYNEHIIGFLDNDSCKVGKRVYGTPKFVFTPSELTKYKDQQITIILFAGPYKNEIKNQYDQIHTNIKYIDINI